jgi:amino acid transporter
MSISTAPVVPAGLRRNYLSLPEVVAQAVGGVAPSGSPALIIPAVFATVGNGTWLAYLFATIALLLVSWSINQFASRAASPGALYVYAAKGLGPIWGAISGWSLLVAYVFTAAAVIGGSVNYLLVLVHMGLGTAHDYVFGILLSLVAGCIAWMLAYRDIKLSTRAILVIEFITAALILALIVGWFCVKGHPFDPQQATLKDVTGDKLRLGLVLAFFSFVGFESATSVGVEARRPFEVVPKAVIISVLACGFLFVVSAYGLVAAFHSLSPTLDKAEAPLTVISVALGVPFVGILISAGVALSFFACVLGSVNAGARVLFALSKHGLVHTSTGKAHASNATPHVAVCVVALVAIIASVSLSVAGIGLLDGFNYLGSIATFGFLFTYILVAISAPVFLYKIGALKPIHIGITVLTVGLLVIPLVGSVYPIPDWPVSLLPWLFLAMVAMGFGYFIFLKLKDPGRLLEMEADLLEDSQ